MNKKNFFLSDGIIVREEFFGALIFNQNNGKVLEINKTGAFVVNQFINGFDPYERISTLYPKQNKDKVKQDIDSFLEFL